VPPLIKIKNVMHKQNFIPKKIEELNGKIVEENKFIK